jgi:hypothetical protein
VGGLIDHLEQLVALGAQRRAHREQQHASLFLLYEQQQLFLLMRNDFFLLMQIDFFLPFYILY